MLDTKDPLSDMIINIKNAGLLSLRIWRQVLGLSECKVATNLSGSLFHPSCRSHDAIKATLKHHSENELAMQSQFAGHVKKVLEELGGSQAAALVHLYRATPEQHGQCSKEGASDDLRAVWFEPFEPEMDGALSPRVLSTLRPLADDVHLGPMICRRSSRAMQGSLVRRETASEARRQTEHCGS
ncbi:hypothetical protein GGTG_14180 [Gaeumannomyces tritici R3-111a-1]|uniref:Uncharacterized protein n=1 Tax=Gaeumannomyces tritici (strain R3-111a-1) TaxID=644352 RepID=J3PKV8_GAET3|nr:hypothetical protein GGTG_14180 [Gaeumannomyces tritici R3-111a-1]EJT68237.1 hypothetical protein GGTG_14180 [Gaeumannomyces tritici R3-111a-1]